MCIRDSPMGGGHVSRPDFGMPQPDPAYPLTEFYLLLQHALCLLYTSIALLTAMRSKDPNSQVGACIVSSENKIPVSYTHLDVYKRQLRGSRR